MHPTSLRAGPIGEAIAANIVRKLTLSAFIDFVEEPGDSIVGKMAISDSALRRTGRGGRLVSESVANSNGETHGQRG